MSINYDKYGSSYYYQELLAMQEYRRQDLMQLPSYRTWGEFRAWWYRFKNQYSNDKAYTRHYMDALLYERGK